MADRNTRRNTFSYSPGILINYEVEGHGTTPVVFIHGFAASLVTWNDIREFFPTECFRLFFLDLKGFGFSSKPRDGRYGVEDQATVVLAFIRANALHNVVLIGHSFGGGVALQAVLKCEQDQGGNLIRGLVLLDCAAYPQRLPLLMRILKRPVLSRALMLITPARWIVRYTLRRIFANREAITGERINRYATSFSRRGFAYVLIRTVEGLVTVESERRDSNYRRIRIPTLIIWGKEDRVAGSWQALRLHAEIEGSRLEMIDQCGHNPHEEYPQKTCDLIRGFIVE